MERYSLLSTIWEQDNVTEAQFRALLGSAPEDVQNIIDSLPFPQGKDLKEMVENIETEIIHQVIKDCGYNQTEAARRLGIARTTLWRKIHHDEERNES